MQREKCVGRGDKDSNSRASYANDIFTWMPLTILRHWGMQAMASDKTHHAEDMGFQYVKTIVAGGDGYLDRRSLQNTFHHYFPLSGKGESVVERNLGEMKEHIKSFVVVSPTSARCCTLSIIRACFCEIHHTDEMCLPASYQARIAARRTPLSDQTLHLRHCVRERLSVEQLRGFARGEEAERGRG